MCTTRGLYRTGDQTQVPGQAGLAVYQLHTFSPGIHFFPKSINLVLSLRAPAQVMCLLLNYPGDLCGHIGPVPSRSHATLVSLLYLYKLPEVIT